jgi:hypothetical protein
MMHGEGLTGWVDQKFIFMQSYLRAKWLLAFPAFGFSASDICPSQPQLLQGTTVSSLTRQPIENVHLYIVPGEEEAFSQKDGTFKLNTWQQFPVTIAAEHSKYKTVKIVLKEKSQQPFIQLEPK